VISTMGGRDSFRRADVWSWAAQWADVVRLDGRTHGRDQQAIAMAFWTLNPEP